MPTPIHSERQSSTRARAAASRAARLDAPAWMSSYVAIATAVYRRFARQIRAHPRHRVKLALAEEVRREFARPPNPDPALRARAMARSLLALTWLRRAAADARSTEGELLYTLMGQRDSVMRRAMVEASRPKKVKLRRSSGTGAAEEALLRATYGPLTDLIGVRGVGGEYWSDE